MRSAEKIKKLVKNLKLGIETHAQTDQAVLNELLDAQEKSKKQDSAVVSPNIRRQKMFDRSRAWKVAAVIAVVIGAGALAATVGLKVRKLYFRGVQPDGKYLFSTEPEIIDVRDGHTFSKSRAVTSRPEPGQTIDVEQKIKDLEEVERLRQQDTGRRLHTVCEREVNGALEYRLFSFKYSLSDGREIEIVERDPDTKDCKRILTEAQKEEIHNLMEAHEYERSTEQEKIRGRVFVFKRMKYVLSDGTEVINSYGTPKDS